MENKPFIFGVATSGDNFTDREKETERLWLIFSCAVATGIFTMPLHPLFSNKHLRKWTNGWSISNCFFPVSAPKSRWDRTRCLIFPYRSK